MCITQHCKVPVSEKLFAYQTVAAITQRLEHQPIRGPASTGYLLYLSPLSKLVILTLGIPVLSLLPYERWHGAVTPKTFRTLLLEFPHSDLSSMLVNQKSNFVDDSFDIVCLGTVFKPDFVLNHCTFACSYCRVTTMRYFRLPKGEWLVFSSDTPTSWPIYSYVTDLFGYRLYAFDLIFISVLPLHQNSSILSPLTLWSLMLWNTPWALYTLMFCPLRELANGVGLRDIISFESW